MATVTTHGLTTEDFLALPDDGVRRELIDGEVVQRGVTIRNRFHSRCLVALGAGLHAWAEASGNWIVLGGEVGFCLQRNPDTTVGVDLAVVSRNVLDSQDESSSLVCGCPHVAIEILSPSDTQGLIRQKTKQYLDHGAAAVWLVDPEERILRIHRAGQPPQQFNETEQLSSIPELPGFTLNLRQIFD